MKPSTEKSSSSTPIRRSCSACGYIPEFEWPWLIEQGLYFCASPCRDARFRRFKRPVVESAIFTGSDGQRYEFERILESSPK